MARKVFYAEHIDVTVKVTFDLGPSNLNQFILESKWTFAPNLRKFSQGLLEILST